MTRELSPYGVNLWRSIRALWDDFKSSTKVNVKNGEKTSFWGDPCHEMCVLRSIYPKIHNLMLYSKEPLQKCGHLKGGNQV